MYVYSQKKQGECKQKQQQTQNKTHKKGQRHKKSTKKRL